MRDCSEISLVSSGPHAWSANDTSRSLFAPTLPPEKSFNELMSALKQHFDPKPLITRFQGFFVNP